MSKLKKYSLLFIAILMVAVSALSVYAAEPTSGSLTIILHEQKNGDTTTNPVMEGIEYTIYDEDYNEIDVATTNYEGKVVFSNLALGKYCVEVSNIKDGVSNLPDRFWIEIPRTNAEGNGFDYDIIVEPKIQTAFGDFKLVKSDTSGNPIEGVTFKMQAKLEGGVNSVAGYEWEDYIPEGEEEVVTITTDANGTINLNNLPSSLYWDSGELQTAILFRLVEISAPEGYIINNNILSQLYWKMNAEGEIEFQSSINSEFFEVIEDADGNIMGIEYTNEKPEITKQVKNSAGTFVDVAGINAIDTVSFKITADVPLQIEDISTYKITDSLPQGLILDRDSIKVEAITLDGTLEVPEYVYTLSDTGLELDFDTSEMAHPQTGEPFCSSIIVTYNATVDMENITIGGEGNVNTVTLEYTDKIAEDGSEEDTTTTTDVANVHTGALKIEKVEKGNLTNKLAGAKFKIATTKANAEAGTFVKDAQGNDIEVTTDENGFAEIKGLAYADDTSDTSYWLVETQAPTYEETVDGQKVTKSYNLLKNPLEVQVGKTTYNTAVQVQNSKGLDLPATGGIGIAIFAVVGITLMVISKKMNKEEVK